MKILVTGKNGQVALSLSDLNGGDVEIIALGRPELDITDYASIERALDTIKPDIVVNAAAYTAVDKAEEEATEAFRINRDGAKNVATATAKRKIPIIHISTDYVFSGIKRGEKKEPYLESDPVGPINVYGLSKLEGEWAVAEANPDHIVLRTAWVYSPYGDNFVKTMLKLADTRDEISVVSDQTGTPTSAAFIAESIVNIASQVLSSNPPKEWRGTFNLTAAGSCDRLYFTQTIMQFADKTIRLSPVSSEFYPAAARRPLNTILNITNLDLTFAIEPINWENYLKECIDKIKSK